MVTFPWCFTPRAFLGHTHHVLHHSITGWWVEILSQTCAQVIPTNHPFGMVEKRNTYLGTGQNQL
jgi:hypothetical protein